MVEENTSPAFEIAESMQITDLETLRVLADPLRLSIIEYLIKPSTVKRIAEQLNKPPTKLYYHFNLLEKHNLIQLVDTRVVSGIIEKHYQASAKNFQVERGLLAPGSEIGNEGIEVTVSGLLADTKNDILESAKAGVIKADENTPLNQRMFLNQMRCHLTDAQAIELYTRMEALLSEYGALGSANSQDEDFKGTVYKGLIILHPTNRVMGEDITEVVDLSQSLPVE